MKELIITLFVLYIIYRLYKSFDKSINERQNAEEMIVKFSRQIGVTPNNPRAYFLRGTCHQRLMNYRVAIDDYSKALELNPDNKSFKFEDSYATFDNITILRNRSSAKSSLGDKFGAEQDLQLINKILGR